MRILMIAPQPFFQPRGTPFSVLGRLKALSYLEHEVDLLTYHVGQDVVIPGVRIFRTASIGFIRDIPIGPSWMKPFLDILLFVKAFSMLRKGHYELLHTHEEACFFGILLARLFGIRHLYDMHSSLPQQLGNFRFTRFRPLIRLFEWLEQRTINTSNALITICPALEEHIRKTNGHIPHVMIENVASEEDPQAVTEEEVRAFKTAHSLMEKNIVLYTGTFEPYQGLDLLIASAEQVLHRYKNVLFLFVGGKPEQIRRYQNLVQERGLAPYFRFPGKRPPEEMPRWINLSDVLVSPRSSGTNTPLKIYTYLRSGKPIVATNLYTHTQVLNPDISVLVEPSPESMAQGILTVLEDAALAQQLGQQAQQLFEDVYSFRTFVQKTEQVLQMALG